MISTHLRRHLALFWNVRPQAAAIGLTMAICLGYWMYTNYLEPTATFLVGLALAPILIVTRAGKSDGVRWSILALISLILCLIMPTRTFAFFAWAFTALSFVERWLGRIAPYAFYLVVMMSSVVKNWIDVFGFPIRLELSKYAAKSLAAVGLDATSSGNVIVLNDLAYSVDPECLGLVMVQASFLFALAVCARSEQRTQKRLPYGSLLFGIMPFVLLLNLGYNFLRIILLVVMDWMPGNIMHDIAGLVGLCVYVFLPTYFVIHFAYKRLGILQVSSTQKPASAAYSGFRHVIPGWLPVILLVGVLYLALPKSMRGVIEERQWPQLALNIDTSAYQITHLIDGVTKYQNAQTLIYVKPIRGFFSSEHSPLICWEGSGYQFINTQERQLMSGQKIYIGQLTKKGSESLHTAWWYSNGAKMTNSQVTWRWLDLTGAAPFFLVNVSATSHETLEQQVDKLVLLE